MTIQGALADLNNLLNADDVPFYYKGSIEKVIETIEMEFNTPLCKDQLKEKMLKYGFTAPDMTVAEFVEDFESL